MNTIGQGGGNTSAPLLLFYVQLHDAIRRELSSIIGVALSLERISLESGGDLSEIESSVLKLKERYKFLEQVYKYHSSIEDEVLYPALDAKVKNVTLAYSVEHEDEEHLLEELSSILMTEDVVESLKSETASDTFEVVHKLTRKVEEVHTTLKQHLEKEEEQLLPLLQQNFNMIEQAGLVVQFLCCIPVSAIEPMLHWLLGSLSYEDMMQMTNQVKDVIHDPGLKAIVEGWLEPGHLKALTESSDAEKYLHSQASFVCCGSGTCDASTNDIEDIAVPSKEYSPLKEVVYFHQAIRSAMSSFAEEAKLLNSSVGVSPEQLQALAERHRFIRAVCHFHSTSEDDILFPVLHRVVDDEKELIRHQCEEDHTTETARFEALGRLLGDVRACARRGAKEVSELTGELADVAQKLSRSMHSHMAREENDVFPILMKKLCPAEQRYIVWRLMQAMPLRLLERFMPWIAVKIPKGDVARWLADMMMASQPAQRPLVDLLFQWASRSLQSEDAIVSDNPGDFPIKTCGSQQVQEEIMNGDLPEHYQRPKRIKTGHPPKEISTHKHSTETPDGDDDRPIVLVNPIDHIFQFHKALRQELKDLEKAALTLQQTAAASQEWTSDSALGAMITDLQTRFEFLRGIYRAHSRAEDEIVFPALESKETLSNVSHAYSIDHKQEEHLLEDVSNVVSGIGACASTYDLEYLRTQASKLSKMCAAIRASLETHVRAEEKELWPLFTEHFTMQEQEELVGMIIGQTGAEVLQVMLSWVTKSMTEDESNAMMSSLKSASKSTAFEHWLGAAGPSRPDSNGISNGSKDCDNQNRIGDTNSPALALKEHEAVLAEVAAYLAKHNSSGVPVTDQMNGNILAEPTSLDATPYRPGWEDIFRMNQKQLEAAVRHVSADDSLGPQRKAYLIQHLMASRYIVAQQKRNPVLMRAEEGLQRQLSNPSPSHIVVNGRPPSIEQSPRCSTPGECAYHNKEKNVLGCKHYARKAKLVSPCCEKNYVCRLCHDEHTLDHKMDRYQVQEMICMVCGLQQEVAKVCSGCSTSMAAYYCGICHLFDDDDSKDIYHCPFCNFCRRGKGLGKDSFHCMQCNACMSLELFNKHKCTEAALSGTCPVCSDPLFESNTPIKELPCGHFMHSLCFGAYVKYSYTCPICFKSLGDMEVYWKMIDAMLCAETMPLDYRKKTQTVRCNDCAAISEAPFHFVYHKCSSCNGYNTRVHATGKDKPSL